MLSLLLAVFYITNLNNALKDHPQLQGKPVDELIANLDAVPDAIRIAVRNNGGGHANHSLFWQIMKPGGGGDPTGALAQAITSDLGGLAAFKESLGKAALGRFGSGWGWLISAKITNSRDIAHRTRIAQSWMAPRH